MTRGAVRFLLPHERWLAGWLLKRQRTHRTEAVVALEQKYGTQGMIWLDASLANAQFVLILGVVCFIIIFAHPTRTSKIGLYLFAALLLFLALNIVRFCQASRAGRRFRRHGH